MGVVVIAPPGAMVGLSLAKSHLRVDTTADDELIALMIAAAQAAIDGPGGWLDAALCPQELELRIDSFSADQWRVGPSYAWDQGWADAPLGRWPFNGKIELPFPPLIEVTQITYEDANGADQVLLPGGWKTDQDGVEPALGAWPSGRVAADAVRIRYRAGYVDGDGNAAPPPRAKQALLLMVGSLYANRESDVIDARAVVAENPAVEALLSTLRVYA